MTSAARVLIASNRLPFTVATDSGQLALKPACGGLAAALGPLHRKRGSVWFGWPGDRSTLDERRRAILDAELRMTHVVPVDLTGREVAEYYDGICNSVLWPVLHYAVDRVPIRLPSFQAYRAVNERFAAALAAEYRPGDVCWVHDYHLMLVPAMLRARIPDAAIGFFLHTPFPAADVFRVIPWRRELLDGLLGATLIGLQTERDTCNFADALRLLTNYHPSSHAVIADGREIQFAAYPVGIDPERLDAAADVLDVQANDTTPAAPRRQLLLGIDRLDYTKGISRRLAAYEHLLAENPSLREAVELRQVAVPSREHVPSYKSLKDEIEQQVAAVNRRFGTPGWTPVHYVIDAVPAADLPKIYRAADVMLVTSIRDGMNLVAKEFVWSRTDEDGVLILSELAGAAEQLRDALLVNPYSIEDLAAAMLTALSLDRDERRLRMHALRQEVFAAGAEKWMERFLADLARPIIDSQTAGDHVVQSIGTAIAAGSTVVLAFSYEAALAGLDATEPSRPDAELSELLDAVSQRSGIDLHIVSSASVDTLDSWFPTVRAVLWAEEGAWRRTRNGRRWRRLPWISTDWKDDVRKLFEQFVTRTPGAFVDERGTSLTWHYGRCDRRRGHTQAQTLAALLRDGSAATGYAVTESGDRLTVRPSGWAFARTLETAIDGRTDSTRLVVFDGADPSAATRRVLRARDLLISVGGTRDVCALPLTDGRMVRDVLRELASIGPDRLAESPVLDAHEWMMMPLRTA